MNSLVGRKLRKYKVLEEIGRGGFAVVYKALDMTLDRLVALKVLAPHLVWEKGFVQRFEREAKTAANLRHPNIVVIHEVGKIRDLHYVAMEYLEGRTLKHLIEEEGALPVAKASPILQQVASALDHAHDRGVVHRDIKPSNVIVSDMGHVTLTDFGIVKAAEGTKLTTTGTGLGTPEYMSPEQGQGLEVDRRSDIYSLGVVLYEMLTGKVPFTGTTPLAILHKHVYETPAPIRSVYPRLSEPVERVVDKALAKNPSKRFTSAGEMTRALAGATRGVPEPLTARERIPSERPIAVAPPVRRGLPVWALAGGGAGIIVLIVIIAFFAWGRGPARPSGVAMLPTATLTASPTDTPVPTRTATATFIPTATSTPTCTSTPTSTAAPTSTPTSTSTPTATPLPPAPMPATATPGFKYPAPELFRPAPWERFRDPNLAITLEWRSLGPLESDEYYELRMGWYIGGKRYFGDICKVLTRDLTWGLTREWTGAVCWITFGYSYLWSVRVVKVEGGVVTHELSPPSERVFTYSH